MKLFIFIFAALVIAAALQGCRSGNTPFLAGTDDKNIGMDGYVLYGNIRTSDQTTGTPVGKMIVGRVVYKSRKVGIPADQKVPNTGNFKSVRTKSLFGTEEHIVEYDFTAGSDAEAAAASARLESVKQQLIDESQKK